MTRLLEEFRQFAVKGNVMDLAVGVIIGGAFSGIVNSVVKDLITPLIGLFGGQPKFDTVYLGPLAVGNFVNALLAFLILAAVVFFLVVKPLNTLMRLTKAKAEAKPAEPAPLPDDVKLLMEIRDLLKAQQTGSATPPPRP